MKYTYLFAIVAVAALLAVPASAATFSFTSANVSLKAGQSFNTVITLNPQDVKNYTAKIELNYPANLLEVTSFSFGSGWTQIPQPGYDLTDNTAGVLIKSGGYPGGIASSVVFGTVSFRAKASGNATISLGGGSKVYDASSSNVLTSSGSVISVAIAPAAAPTPTPTSMSLTGTVKQPTPTISPSPSESVTPTVSPSETVSPGPSSAPAGGQAMILGAIGNVITLGTGNNWLGLLVVIVLLAAIYYIVRKIRKPKIQQ